MTEIRRRRQPSIWEKIAVNKILRFVVVGVFVTVVDYTISTLLALLVPVEGAIFWGLDWTALATVISGTIATILAFLLHNKITWHARDPGRSGIIKFFVWNALMVITLRPAINWGFGTLTGLYEFAMMISQALHLPFSYEFIEVTGRFGLMSAVVMILNFLVYDRLVFDKAVPASAEDKSAKRSADR